MITGSSHGIQSDMDRQFQMLLAHGEASENLRLNPKALRPCLWGMLKTTFYKGQIPSRSDVSAVLAAELVKIGFDLARILYELARWNKRNQPPLKQSDLKSTVSTSLRHNYNYSCKHEYLKEFCVGFDVCSHSKGLSNISRYNFRAFFNYHWQQILKNKAVMVYMLALPELGLRKGLKPGDVIYENQAAIARTAGISRKHVKGALEELATFGLIEYKPGVPRRWEGKASEIRRIFPIPKPSREAIMKVTNDA